jgi:Spy/CpxP family protein refolding chaperone
MFANRIVSIVSVSFLLLAFSGVAVAQRPAARLARMKKFLALTDQQVNDIRDLLKKHQQAAFPLRQDLRARNHDLRTLLDSREPIPDTVGRAVIARHSLKNQLRALRENLQVDIVAKLTPEQKQKLEQMKAGRQRARA